MQHGKNKKRKKTLNPLILKIANVELWEKRNTLVTISRLLVLLLDIFISPLVKNLNAGVLKLITYSPKDSGFLAFKYSLFAVNKNKGFSFWSELDTEEHLR